MDKSTENNSIFYTSKQMKEMCNKRKESPDLIGGVLPSGVVSVLEGEPGVGKSFVALDWAIHIAGGIDWYGCSVQEPRTVVYIVGGGWTSFPPRLRRWLESHDEEVIGDVRSRLADHLFFVDGISKNINMAADGSEYDLVDKLKDINPDLIIFDSFSMLALVEAYDKEHISEVFSRAGYLARELNSSVLFTHYDNDISVCSDMVIMAKKPKYSDGFYLSTKPEDGGRSRIMKSWRMDGFYVSSPGVLFKRSESPNESLDWS